MSHQNKPGRSKKENKPSLPPFASLAREKIGQKVETGRGGEAHPKPRNTTVREAKMREHRRYKGRQAL